MNALLDWIVGLTFIYLFVCLLQAGEPICPLPSPGALPPASAVTLQSAAVWDILSWLTALANGYDGALRWCIAEKSYVRDVT